MPLWWLLRAVCTCDDILPMGDEVEVDVGGDSGDG